MYSTHKEGKTFVAGRIISTLKNKISVSENVLIDKLDDIVNK